ncbi:sugar ABC transporter permease [Spirochaetia bacterium]|nr:sugar ABC transporter permease [Spirochaetia bacterium]
MTRNVLQPKWYLILAILFIPVGIYLFMVIAPLFFAGFYSFFKWSGGKSMEFIGFGNYAAILKDGTFRDAFKNTFVFTFLMVLGQVGIAFVVTLFLTMKWVRFTEFHRRILFFPNVISAVVIGLMWQNIYSNQVGFLNPLLMRLGLESWIRPWLSDPKIALYSVAVPVIWQYIGYYVVILSSAISAIPKDILEVAELDGANGWKRSVYITIPMIHSTLRICVMICITGSFRAFDHISVMTGGGPAGKTMVLALYNYEVSFSLMRMGYGCAVALAILLISLVLTFGSQALLGGKRYE